VKSERGRLKARRLKVKSEKGKERLASWRVRGLEG